MVNAFFDGSFQKSLLLSIFWMCLFKVFFLKFSTNVNPRQICGEYGERPLAMQCLTQTTCVRQQRTDSSKIAGIQLDHTQHFWHFRVAFWTAEKYVPQIVMARFKFCLFFFSSSNHLDGYQAIKLEQNCCWSAKFALQMSVEHASFCSSSGFGWHS